MTLAHLLTRTARGWLVVTAVLAIGRTLLLAHWASTRAGGVLTPECNPSKTLDAAVLTRAHLSFAGARGPDPEGLIALWGTCLSAGAGATAGHVLLSARQRWGRERPARPIAAAPGMLGLAGTSGLVRGAAWAVLLVFCGGLVRLLHRKRTHLRP